MYVFRAYTFQIAFKQQRRQKNNKKRLAPFYETLPSLISHKAGCWNAFRVGRFLLLASRVFAQIALNYQFYKLTQAGSWRKLNHLTLVPLSCPLSSALSVDDCSADPWLPLRLSPSVKLDAIQTRVKICNRRWTHTCSKLSTRQPTLDGSEGSFVCSRSISAGLV